MGLSPRGRGSQQVLTCLPNAEGSILQHLAGLDLVGELLDELAAVDADPAPKWVPYCTLCEIRGDHFSREEAASIHGFARRSKSAGDRQTAANN